jgi:uncharacterized membrane protein YbhN (UPF0104 family)
MRTGTSTTPIPSLARWRRLLPLATLAAILVAFGLAAGRSLELARALDNLANLDGARVAAALACAVLLQALKAACWRSFAAALGYPLRWRSALAVYLAGQWFIFVRGAGLSRIAMAGRFGVPYPTAFAVGVAAAVAELGGLALTALVASLSHAAYLVVVLPLACAMAAALWVLGADGGAIGRVEAALPARYTTLRERSVHTRRGRRQTIVLQGAALVARYAAALRHGRRSLRGWSLAVGLASSAAHVVAGGGVLWFAAGALGVGDVAFSLAVLIHALSQLVSKPLPLPLGLGVVVSGTLLLAASGVDLALAALVLVLYRLIGLAANMLVGGAGLLALRILPLPAVAPRLNSAGDTSPGAAGHRQS